MLNKSDIPVSSLGCWVSSDGLWYASWLFVLAFVMKSFLLLIYDIFLAYFVCFITCRHGYFSILFISLPIYARVLDCDRFVRCGLREM